MGNFPCLSHAERWKRRACRDKTSYAVYSGKLTKSPCECGNTKVEAHHPDYDKPFDVLWVCESCHTKIDPQRNGKIINLTA